MAKLNKAKQKEIEEAAKDNAFAPIDDGAYHVKLRDVDTTKEGPKGPYWSWEFEILDESAKGRRLWNNTSLSAAAAFKMQETFDAFGVKLDTDTDELIGKICKAIVSTRTIQEGNRKGEPANQIDRLKLADEDVAEKYAKAVKDQKDMADIF